MEAGRPDDRVELALAAVGGADPALGDLGDRVGDDLRVRLAERAVVGVGHRDPLAAERVARGELRAQLRVRDLPAQVQAGDLLEHGREPPVDDRPQHRRLLQDVDEPADGALRRRHAPEHLALEVGHGAVGVGHHPHRRALEQVQGADLSLDLRARSAPTTRRCRSPRPARRRGRGRDPTAAEWNIVPSKRSIPGTSGSLGSVSPPIAPTSTSAVSSPCEVSMRQRRRVVVPGRAGDARGRSGCGGPRRARPRPGAGTRGSPTAAGRAGSSRGWARTRTSRAPRGCRTGSPGRCCRARCRRCRRRARARRSRRPRRRRSRIAMPIPENPAPMIATRACRAPPSPFAEAAATAAPLRRMGARRAVASPGPRPRGRPAARSARPASTGPRRSPGDRPARPGRSPRRSAPKSTPATRP